MLYVFQNKHYNLCCYIFESLIHVILHKQENIIKLGQTFKMNKLCKSGSACGCKSVSRRDGVLLACV